MTPQKPECHTVECRDPGGYARSSGQKPEQTRVSLSSRRPNPWLPKLPWSVNLESDLQQNRHLPHTPQLLQRRQDRGRRQHDTSMWSSGGDLGTTFEDAMNTPIGDALEAPYLEIDF
ncbi:hypothetical protein ISCGN_027555 [Ixodes scapularis]